MTKGLPRTGFREEHELLVGAIQQRGAQQHLGRVDQRRAAPRGLHDSDASQSGQSSGTPVRTMVIRTVPCGRHDRDVLQSLTMPLHTCPHVFHTYRCRRLHGTSADRDLNVFSSKPAWNVC